MIFEMGATEVVLGGGNGNIVVVVILNASATSWGWIILTPFDILDI
jgi:hypothetical protein